MIRPMTDPRRMYDVTLIRLVNKREVPTGEVFTAYLDLSDGDTIDPHLIGAVRRAGEDPRRVAGEFVLVIREKGRSQALLRYAAGDAR